MRKATGPAFLRLLESPMRGMELAERVQLLEFVASSGKRIAWASEYGIDVFRAVAKEAGWSAGLVEQTFDALQLIRARYLQSGRPDDFARFIGRVGRGNEDAWRLIDDGLRIVADPRRAEIEAELLALQQRTGGVVSDAQALAELGITQRDRILGELVDRFELGNFAHRWAELLIPPLLLPRGLRSEFAFQLPDGSWRRIDRIDFAGGVLYEVKPIGSLEAGREQARLYAQWLDAHPVYRRPDGGKWSHAVVTYDADRLRSAMRQVGDLRRWIGGGG